MIRRLWCEDTKAGSRIKIRAEGQFSGLRGVHLSGTASVLIVAVIGWKEKNNRRRVKEDGVDNKGHCNR